MARVTVTRSTLLAWGTVLVLALGRLERGLRAQPHLPRPSAAARCSELAETPEETTTATTSTTSTSSTESSTTNDQKTILIAIVAAVILLSGIAFVIVRDARRWPRRPTPISPKGVRAATRPSTLRKRRAKAKAARQQRKRNR